MALVLRQTEIKRFGLAPECRNGTRQAANLASTIRAVLQWQPVHFVLKILRRDMGNQGKRCRSRKLGQISLLWSVFWSAVPCHRFVLRRGAVEWLWEDRWFAKARANGTSGVGHRQVIRVLSASAVVRALFNRGIGFQPVEWENGAE
jgi:hypothetical protein